VASDLHKSFGGIFAIPSISPDKNIQQTVRKYMVDTVNGYLTYLDKNLEGKDYLTGKNFTPADAYAFVVTGWSKWVEIPLTPYRNLQHFMTRVANRPAVDKVFKAEGLK
jgi:glutathione S-transferase